jgi:hypothetical protein
VPGAFRLASFCATALWLEIAREWRVLHPRAISGLFLSLVVAVVYVLLLILHTK